MNPLLDQLQPYPFARLREAMQGVNPPEGVTPVHLHIGEPKHPTPEVITNALTASLYELEKYPLTAGLPELRQACADWLQRRYDGLTVNPDTEVLPVLGSREALFSFVQTVLNPVSDDLRNKHKTQAATRNRHNKKTVRNPIQSVQTTIKAVAWALPTKSISKKVV